MHFLCRWGIHAWSTHPATSNPSRLVRRCKRCSGFRVVQLEQRERKSLVRLGRRTTADQVTDA